MALDLADTHGAAITGFSVVNPDRVTRVGPTPAGAFSYHIKLMETRLRQAREQADAQAAKLRSACGDAGLVYTDMAMEGNPDASLVDAWRFCDIGILPSRIWNPGSDDLEDVRAVLHIIALGLRPMLVMPETPYARPRKAVVALSGSLESAKALKQFALLRPWPDIALHLITVGSPKSGETAEELLDQASGYAAAHGFEVTTAALPPASDRTQAILDEGQSVGAGLYVLGSSYSRFLKFERYGSHALGMLERARVPLFLSH